MIKAVMSRPKNGFGGLENNPAAQQGRRTLLRQGYGGQALNGKAPQSVRPTLYSLRFVLTGLRLSGEPCGSPFADEHHGLFHCLDAMRNREIHRTGLTVAPNGDGIPGQIRVL